MTTPQPNTPLRQEDFEGIVEAVEYRMLNFPGEDIRTSLMVVLLNYGNRFATVECMNGEWSGHKWQLIQGNDPSNIPKCPNGHVLFEGYGLKLGWLKDTLGEEP